ncbi:MAG TPA: PEP/pyruvate-binding domain-containing protein [Spirochaetota bacterium]|nr:PEP/pyruvate-binding domain-containing protein [Spirochaetota bacterium]
MTDSNLQKDQLINILRERAKELNCLYQVEEILSCYNGSLHDMFMSIIDIIPSGWQYPEICQARILFQGIEYKKESYTPTEWADIAEIRIEEKVTGFIEVSYTQEVTPSETGYFLEKERKLIATIADRISQTIFHRKLQLLFRELENAGKDLTDKTNREWMVITGLLRRTDENLYHLMARKMIYHLFWNGIKDAKLLLNKYGSDFTRSDADNLIESNSPSLKQSRDRILETSDQVFITASKNLSDNEIMSCIQKWINENKTGFLVKTIDSGSARLNEIIDAIQRYRVMTGSDMALAASTEKWLRISLIRRFFSDSTDFINIAKKHLEVNDFFELTTRIIHHAGSNGKLGGKSAGLFMAKHILLKAADGSDLFNNVRTPATWYITADSLTEFLRYNDLEELNEQKYKDPEQIRIEYPNIIQLFKNAHFPSEIKKGILSALDELGENPIIVRSSSLLEDRVGTAFSGKYKSLFLANQGDRETRFNALLDAISEVYASLFAPDPIIYRSERGLIDLHEEMGIMIQEVVGVKAGGYFFPAFAGIAFSNNEFRWSPRLKREDGLIRLVPGLGTRAVDRVSNDYPVMISPGQPALRVNVSPEEIRHYSPSWIDVINLNKNCFETIPLSELLKEYGEEIPNIHQMVSVYRDGHIYTSSRFDLNCSKDDLLMTFEGVITRTPFVKQVHAIVQTLQEGFGMPVDIEFASDGNNFYLLQCRPQNSDVDAAPSAIPHDIEENKILFNAKRFISNGRVQDITHIVWVNPAKYSELENRTLLAEVGIAVGRLNSILPKKQFILMGPGRWGSRGDIKLGVQVTYADICNTAVLIEISTRKGAYSPELSFGTHFFQDLVETGIRYIPLYPEDREVLYNEIFLTGSDNMLPDVLPEYDHLSDVIRVIDVPRRTGGEILKILLNADLGEAVAYFTEAAVSVESGVIKPKQVEPQSDDFWRWRMHMAEQIAAQLEPSRFGVKGIYVMGSTVNGTAGPCSDLDLLLHFTGTMEQRERLLLWLEGWSLSLAEMNYLRTGYSTGGLLDVHLITDEDIAARTSYAVKINAVTDPARPLAMKSRIF